MSKYTPGPWTAGNSNGGNANMIYAPGHEAVAQVYGLPINHGIDEIPEKYAQGLADARLIAAAPQLVEALDSLIGWAVMRSDWAAAGKSEPTDHPIQRARAALKSAGVSHE